MNDLRWEIDYVNNIRKKKKSEFMSIKNLANSLKKNIANLQIGGNINMKISFYLQPLQNWNLNLVH